MNELLQSAAKPRLGERSQTIPEGSTLSKESLDFGSGCPSAHNGGGDDIVENKRKTNFIKKATLKHEDKFDYSQIEYVNAKTKIKIICPIHGEFEQTPDKHLNSIYACPTCNEESRSSRRKGKNLNNKNRSKSFEDFVEKANNKYNNKFTYSLEEE